MGFFSDLFSFLGEAVTETPIVPFIAAAVGAPGAGTILEDLAAEQFFDMGAEVAFDAGLVTAGAEFGPVVDNVIVDQVGSLPEVIIKAALQQELAPEPILALPPPAPRFGEANLIGAAVQEDFWSEQFPDMGSEVAPYQNYVSGLLPGESGGLPDFGMAGILGPVVSGTIRAAGTSLGARLAGLFGGAGAAARILSIPGVRGSVTAGTAIINGVRVSLRTLWPYVRKYGPTAVAAALGIGAAELANLLMNAPQNPRHRRRGISARDISTTARVVKFTNKMQRTIGCVSRPRWRGYSRSRSHGHSVRSYR